jgi:porin
MRHYLTFLLALLLAILTVEKVSAAEPTDVHADGRIQTSRWEGLNGWTFEAVYTGDYFANVRGGLRRDRTYMDNLDLTMTLDTGSAGLWEGGTFFVYALSNGGAERLSGSIVGDLQTVSNIEAPRTTRLYELWYEHVFLEDRLSVLAGLHDYNSEFAVTEYGGLYLNSSFGINPEIAGGARPSIFPLTSPGLRVRIAPDEQWTFLLGVYDGDPGDPEISEHLPGSTFSSDQGAFIAAEAAHHFHYERNARRYPVTSKIGLWVNTGKFEDLIDTDEDGDPLQRRGNYGGYVIVDTLLYREIDEQGLGAFVQIGAAPGHLNEVDFYAGGGFNYQGLLPGRDRDELGVAVAYASISNELTGPGGRDNAETVLEITYRLVLTDHIAIQPDVQFVFNPGADPAIEDAVVAGLRVEISL